MHIHKVKKVIENGYAMEQQSFRCIYEFQECINDLNCMACEVKKAYYESLYIAEDKKGIVQWESQYEIKAKDSNKFLNHKLHDDIIL